MAKAVVPARCETAEMKDDPLAQAECTAMFKLWARCEAVADVLAKLECQQQVRDGEDPFAADAGPR